MNEREIERHIEQSKALARWFGFAIVAGVLHWQRRNGFITLSSASYAGIVGGAVAINLLHTLYLYTCKACSPLYKYLTVGLDVLLVTVLIAMTGYTRSPFFYVYFLLLISNCMRYGILMSIYLASLVNVCYAFALTIAPPAEREAAVLGGEGLKILAFWGVALYGGGIAARMRRHLHEISAYEDTIAELRADLRARDEQGANRIEKAADG